MVDKTKFSNLKSFMQRMDRDGDWENLQEDELGYALEVLERWKNEDMDPSDVTKAHKELIEWLQGI